MAVFTRIAEEVKRAAVAKIDIAAALHIHDEVIHQRVAVSENIVVAQRARVDFGAGRQAATFWRHAVDRVFELTLRGMASLYHRGVVAGKLDVTVVIGALHLPGINAELAHGAGIAPGA